MFDLVGYLERKGTEISSAFFYFKTILLQQLGIFIGTEGNLNYANYIILYHAQAFLFNLYLVERVIVCFKLRRKNNFSNLFEQ